MEKLKNSRAEQTKRNTVRLGFWTAAWTISMAVATFGPMFMWNNNKTLSLLAIILNLILGIGMIWANARHLKGLDELQQKIQLEAMALALGVGVVGGLSYSLLDITNLIPSEAEIGFLVIMISLTYIAGLVAGQVRYR